MAGRRTQNVSAEAKRIRFDEDKGYILVVTIVNGPQAMRGRMVRVILTKEQMDRIAEFDGNTGMEL